MSCCCSFITNEAAVDGASFEVLFNGRLGAVLVRLRRMMLYSPDGCFFDDGREGRLLAFFDAADGFEEGPALAGRCLSLKGRRPDEVDEAAAFSIVASNCAERVGP